jgi:hypothetical protein
MSLKVRHNRTEKEKGESAKMSSMLNDCFTLASTQRALLKKILLFWQFKV